MSSNRRIVTLKSSACNFPVATVSTHQDARVAVTVPSRAIPPIISPKVTRRPAVLTGSYSPYSTVGIVVTARQNRVAEVADLGIRAGPLGIDHGQGRAESQQGGATRDISSDRASEPDPGTTVQHRQQRDQAEQRKGRSRGRAASAMRMACGRSNCT